MANFWKHVASVFVAIGKGSLKVGLWASQHPQIIADVAAIAKINPSVQAAIATGISVLSQAESK